MEPTVTVQDTEAIVRRHCDARNYGAAATALLEAYGPSILGFLGSRVASRAAADEVFSMFCEDLWRGLPDFEWRCSARAWAYALARHAAIRFNKSADRKLAQAVPLSDAPEVFAAADRVRSTTRPHLRSEVKGHFRALRERLPEQEQTILVLRVDRGLTWNEIAQVLGGPHPLPRDELRTAAARARKRLQQVKAKLRQWAVDEGILEKR